LKKEIEKLDDKIKKEKETLVQIGKKYNIEKIVEINSEQFNELSVFFELKETELQTKYKEKVKQSLYDIINYLKTIYKYVNNEEMLHNLLEIISVTIKPQ
jgi:hypothetical protein